MVIPPDRRLEHRNYTRHAVIKKWINIIEQTLELSVGIDIESLASKSHHEQLVAIHQRMVKLNLMPRTSCASHLESTLRTLSTALRTSYVPAKKYTGNALLVLVDDPDLSPQDNLDNHTRTFNGWRAYAPRIRWTKSHRKS